MATIGEQSKWMPFTASLAQRKVSQQVSGLLRQCRSVGAWIHPDGNQAGHKIEDALGERRSWAFEHADLMEQGLGTGLVHEYLEVPKKDVEVRMCLERSPDRKQFLLTTDDGSCRLLALLNDNGSGFQIFTAKDGEPPAVMGPMFTLRRDGTRERWTLCAQACDHCEKKGRRLCGSRELAHIYHYKEHVEDGDGEIHCLDMEIPFSSDDGDVEIWCPMCRPEREHQCTSLSTRRPKWDARRRTLSLNFFGRCSLASAKNFQLEVVGKPEKVKLLFGKVGAHQFVLDFHRPLSTIQAFAAAVSAFSWQ
jgi:hypothetical protein